MPLDNSLLRQLEALTLESRRKVLGQRQGAHRSAKRGHGLEFSDYRHYELGDHPRHIDWGVYGRTDRLYIKQFLEDRDLTALLIVDASGSMTVPSARFKWDFAQSLAEAISYVTLLSQDSVRLIIPGLPPSPRFLGPASFYSLAKLIEAIKTDPSQVRSGSGLSSAFQEAASFARFPGLAIFISDCLYPIEDLANAFSFLRARNLEIHVIQILSRADIEPFQAGALANLIDHETDEAISIEASDTNQKAYANLLDAHLTALQRHCEQAQIGFVSVTLDKFSDDQLMDTLLRTGILQ